MYLEVPRSSICIWCNTLSVVPQTGQAEVFGDLFLEGVVCCVYEMGLVVGGLRAAVGGGRRRCLARLGTDSEDLGSARHP